MDPTPQSGTDQRRVVRRRNRAPVSCGHCRIRKLKCNRAKPCESCVKTGDAATCFYVPDRSKVPNEDQSSSIQPSRNELINRIDRLEKLVLSAMSNQSRTALPASEIPNTNSICIGTTSEPTPFEDMKEIHKIEIDPDVDQLSTALGVMKVDPDKTVYLGGAHWVSVMSEIYEFRNFFDTNHEYLEHDALENQASSKVTSLLRGTSAPKTLEELNTYIPSRPIADELVARYFNHNSSLLPIIHEPTFRKQYSQYWDDPSKAKIIWLALLFGIFDHAELSSQETGDPAGVLDLKIHSVYRNHAIDCLLAGDYINSGAHTIEALLLYAQAEWMSSQDAIIDTSVVIGMIIRLAMRMGIHRDSKAHPDITAFEGEMRRRIWALIRVMDILYSFQISLPANVRVGEYDCDLPRNIFDAEFDENTIDLPPSRPLTETTEVSYLILRARMLVVFQGILTLTESDRTISVEDVMKHEQSLEEARRMIPPGFQMPPPGESKIVSLRLKRTRINLDRMYQMSQCILHRKFLKPNPAFIQYRRLCIDAAMTLLSHQATVYLDCDLTPSIYPRNIRKRHFATLTTHDFFVACMAIALDLHYGFESEPFQARSADITLWGYDRRNEMITALETSTEFWRISREESVEAAKAHGMFSFVLSKVKNAQLLARAPPGTNPTIDESLINYEATLSNDTIDLKDSAWPPEFDLNMWNSWRGDGDGFESLAQWPPL